MKNKKYIVVAIVLVATIFLTATLAKERNRLLVPERSSANAVDFELVNANGDTLNLKDYRGKTVVLNFWASWCMPCVYEMPSIQKYYERIDTSKIKLVLVSLDQDFNRAIRFMDQKKYSMPYYRPATGMPAALNVSSIPTTFLINSEGSIVRTHTGMLDFEDFGRKWKKLIKESRVP